MPEIREQFFGQSKSDNKDEEQEKVQGAFVNAIMYITEEIESIQFSLHQLKEIIHYQDSKINRMEKTIRELKLRR